MSTRCQRLMNRAGGHPTPYIFSTYRCTSLVSCIYVRGPQSLSVRPYVSGHCVSVRTPLTTYMPVVTTSLWETSRSFVHTSVSITSMRGKNSAHSLYVSSQPLRQRASSERVSLAAHSMPSKRPPLYHFHFLPCPSSETCLVLSPVLYARLQQPRPSLLQHTAAAEVEGSDPPLTS